MRQYVARRRRCWTPLTQIDPVIHLSEGHRSDMPLDLSGLTREERVMVQASISNERDFDRVAEVLIIQHPRIHLRENQRRAKGRIRIDSGASMHMLNKKGLKLRRTGNSKIQEPTTVVTANEKVQTNEEARENVYDLNLFETVQFFEDTPAVLSLGKLCEEH